MRRIWMTGGGSLLTIAALGLGTSLYADDMTTTKTETKTEIRTGAADYSHDRAEMDESHGSVIRGSKLVGMNVENTTGENLGEIHDIVLDVGEGRIAYAVLGFGGYLNLGDKYFAVPFGALTIRGEGEKALLNVSKDQLKNMQGFDKKNWPAQADDRTFAIETNRRYGVELYRGKDQAQLDRQKFWVNRLSKLDDISVKNAAGEDLGEIEEIMIDTREGRIAYAVLQFGGIASLNEKMVAVPWRSLRLDADKEIYYLNADKATLEATAFKEDSWPNFSDKGWARKTHESYGSEPYWETFGYADERGGRMDMGYNALFDYDHPQTIEGKIVDVQTYRVSGEANDGMRLKVQTKEGKVCYVDLGRKADLGAVEFKEGQTVTVTGAKLAVIRATEVHSGGTSVKIDMDRHR